MENGINKLVEQYKIKKKALDELQFDLESYNELIRIKTNEYFKFYKDIFDNLYFKDGKTFVNYVKNYHNMEVKNVECYEGEITYGCIFKYNSRIYDIYSYHWYTNIADTEKIGKIILYSEYDGSSYIREKIGEDSNINVLLDIIKNMQGDVHESN